MNKKVIVIGAGIAGMTAGIQLAKHGFDVTLFEKNEDVGGLCSGYYLKGYCIDACFHWMMGTKKGTTLNNLWREVGALSDDVPIIPLPTLGEFRYGDQRTFLGRDIDQTEKQWLDLSPEDEKAIHEFFSCIRELNSLTELSQAEQKVKVGSRNLFPILRGLPHSATLMKAMNQSREEYAKKFKNPCISFTISHGQTGYNNALFFMVQYAFYTRGDADVPQGGALGVITRMKETFLSLGGKLFLSSPVTQILVDEDKAIGVIAKGGEFKADYVISALDPKWTFDHLLPGRRFATLEKYHKKVAKRSVSSCYNVYLAVDESVKSLTVPTCISMPGIRIGKNPQNWLLIRPYSFDDCFTTNGKTVVSLFVDQKEDDYDYWASLSGEEYQVESDRVENEMLNAFYQSFPQFRENAEVLTRFGPMELYRQTGTTYGALLCFSFTNMTSLYQLHGKAPGIANLYLASQWNRSIGGTPTALQFGDAIAKKILRRERLLNLATAAKNTIVIAAEKTASLLDLTGKEEKE